MSRDFFFVSGAECFRGRLCLRGLNCLRVRVCLRGMGLSPGMSHANASILKSGAEIENQCTDCPCFGLLATSIRKSGLEIENRCTDCPRFDLLAASIRNSRPEIRNRCSAIVPSSRIARLRSRCRYDAASDSIFLRRKVLQFRLRNIVVAVLNGPPAASLAATMPRPILFFFAAK